VGVEDPRALDVHVEVLHVDELGPVLVGARRQGTHHRLLAQLRPDRHDLPPLHVGGETDRQIREPLQGDLVEGDVRARAHSGQR
jgi:hypothetical protein